MNKDNIEILKTVSSPKFINDVIVVNEIYEAVSYLKENKKPIARFEFGDSMQPILKNGEYCIITPIESLNDVNVGDAVLCEVNGYLMTHMVISKSTASNRTPYFLIGDTNMNIYGWTNNIYGIAHGTSYIEKSEEYKTVEEIL